MTFSRYLVAFLLQFNLIWSLLSAESIPAKTVTAADIRSLTPQQTKQETLCRLKATVVFIDHGNAIFVQDETAGTLFWVNRDEEHHFKVGDVVEILGTTRYGLYVPGLKLQSYRLLESNAQLRAVEASYDDLISGRFHYQQVSIQGIVRSISTQIRDEQVNYIMRLAMGSRIVEVTSQEAPDPTWIDCQIRISGLAAGSINDRRQLVRPYLWLNHWQSLEIITPAIPAQETPRLTSTDLMTFHPNGTLSEHRVQVEGIILATFPDGTVHLRDENGSISIKIPSIHTLKIGQKARIMGFPQMEVYSPSLVDAEILEISTQLYPTDPEPLTPNSMRLGHLDQNLVRIEATLNQMHRNENGFILQLNNPYHELQVQTPTLPELPSGTQLALTGIYKVTSVQINNRYNTLPSSYYLRLRDAADLKVLSQPSWWTPKRLSAAAWILLSLCIGALSWIASLKRQVKLQTSALSTVIQRDAMMQERQRIAREFHDTLEQDLSGLSLQLGVALATQSTQSSPKPLNIASYLVQRIQTETRNLLHDLRTPEHQLLNLEQQLQALSEAHHIPDSIQVTVEIKGATVSLPTRTLHHLRMIAQESLTNAIKHASATLIQLRLQQSHTTLTLEVIDNGVGISSQDVQNGLNHFGCMGIRERANKIGAQVSWNSPIEGGTLVQIILPLNSQ